MSFENPISLSSCYYETAPRALNNVKTVCLNMNMINHFPKALTYLFLDSLLMQRQVLIN